MRINTNVYALQAQRQMNLTTHAISRALARLSSGRRINEARDDAAGLAIAENLNSQVRGMRQVAMNINQAFGYLNTADGVLATQMDLVQRMKELALQSASGTLSTTDRHYLETEMLALVDEFDRVANSANFNGTNLLDGTMNTMSIQVGLHKGQTIDFSLPDSRGSAIFTHTQTVGTGSFSLATTSHLTDGNIGVIFEGDVDNDGDRDFAASDGLGATHLFRQNSNGEFIAENLGDLVVSINDYNGDNLVDYVSEDFNGVKSINLQNGNGTFTLHQTIAFGGATLHSIVDFDNDGDFDFVQASGANYRVRLNDGAGTFAAPSATLNIFALATTTFDSDINGDGINDASIIDGVNHRILYALGDSSGGFGARQTLDLGANYVSIRYADFNGDGIQDVVGLHTSDGSAAIRFGSADGTFSTMTTIASAANYSNLFEAQDVNNDGYDDLFFLNSLNDSISVRLSTGDGNFATGTTIALGGGYGSAALIGLDHFADIDGDDKVDLIQQISGSTLILWGDGNGGFTARTTLATQPANLEFSDLNGDGQLDLVANTDIYPDSYLTPYYFLNQGDRTFAEGGFSHYGPTTFESAVAIADFNGDGISDYLLSEDGSSGGHYMNTFTQNTRVDEDGFTIHMRDQEEAQDLLSVFDRALQKLSQRRASIGATTSRLESALNATMITTENLSAARSQILDLDYASETAELTRLQILQQAQSSVLGQANISLQMVLSLLKP